MPSCSSAAAARSRSINVRRAAPANRAAIAAGASIALAAATLSIAPLSHELEDGATALRVPDGIGATVNGVFGRLGAATASGDDATTASDGVDAATTGASVDIASNAGGAVSML